MAARGLWSEPAADQSFLCMPMLHAGALKNVAHTIARSLTFERVARSKITARIKGLRIPENVCKVRS